MTIQLEWDHHEDCPRHPWNDVFDSPEPCECEELRAADATNLAAAVPAPLPPGGSEKKGLRADNARRTRCTPARRPKKGSRAVRRRAADLTVTGTWEGAVSTPLKDNRAELQALAGGELLPRRGPGGAKAQSQVGLAFSKRRA